MNFDRMPAHTGPLVKILNCKIEAYMNAAAAELGLTGTQTHILHFLCEHSGEDVTLHLMEELFRLSHATLSGIVSRLEAKGFVETVVSGSDRRQKFIRPTQKAFDCDKLMGEQITRCETKLTDGIGEENLALMREVLSRMIDNINSITEEEK